MKICLDQGISWLAAQLLRDAGHDAVHLLEVGMSEAEDAEIIAFALQESRAIVTRDSDFHQILASTGATKPSVIRIRIEGLKGLEVATLLRAILEDVQEDLEQGAVVSVQPHRVGVRRLPIRF